MNFSIESIRSVISYRCSTTWSWNIIASKIKDWDYWTVTQGRGWGIIESCSFELQVGSTLLIPPGTGGRIEHDPDHPLHVTACHCDIEGLSKKLMMHHYRDLSTQASQVSWLQRAWQWGDIPTTRARLHGLIWEMHHGPPSPKDPREAKVGRCMEILEHNTRSQPTVPEMAAGVHMSPQHLGRLFRKVTGYGPRQYALRCRVQKAQELLAGTQDSIDQISLECGWEDPSNFARAFKKLTGNSPTALRRGLQGK